MDQKLPHIQLFEAFRQDNQALIDWFKKVMLRENSQFLCNARTSSDSDVIINAHWCPTNCSYELSYTNRGTIAIQVSAIGVTLQQCTIHNKKQDDIATAFKGFEIALKLLQTNLKIAFGKEAERLLGYVIP